MVVQDDDQEKESRPPSVADLVNLCRELNRHEAKYIVIGGMAIIQAGFVRATEDIDLLIETSPENQQKIRAAMLTLPDKAIREVGPDDLERYAVVKVADEIVVDLMKRACGIEFKDAADSIEHVLIGDVSVPFASPELLWRLKQTMREKDRQDILFLRALLNKAT